jgi:hypothetical protein
MADVFLSYSSQDRALAAAVASRLADQGLSVWYDEALGTGTAYRAEIQSALDDAVLVLVLWTPAASRSAWVRDEATRGRDRGVLFSVACGRATVPADFRTSVFGRIRDPRAGPTGSEIATLARGISHIVSAAQSSDRTTSRRLLSRFADYASTSAIYATLGSLVIATSTGGRPAPVDVHNVGVLVVFSLLIGLALGAVAYASSRLFDHLGIRLWSINVGPSVSRLSYRWVGEAAGCAILLMFTAAVKRVKFLDLPGIQRPLMFIGALIFLVLLLMAALAAKYIVFFVCRRCRYFLLQ